MLFPSGWYFFYPVTTGWIFYISLCENSINQNQEPAKIRYLHAEKARGTRAGTVSRDVTMKQVP